MMSRALDDLHEDLRPRAFELIARLAEAGTPNFIVDTLRTVAEHQTNLANGSSWVAISKHLADATGKSRALDLCPYREFLRVGPDKLLWQTHDADGKLLREWALLGTWAERLGLRWGGRWTKGDFGHVELPTA